MTRARFPLLAHTAGLLALALLPHQVGAQPVSPKPAVVETKPAEFRVVHCRTGKEMTLSQLADELSARDVVYFGELHDNAAGHRVYAQLAALLVERRADVVLAMEMFERDVQGVVTDYLRGRVDEAKFLEHSRPWKDYARDYKPLIELAKEKKLDVIAGNLPRPVAAQVANKEGSASPFLPRTTTAPQVVVKTGSGAVAGVAAGTKVVTSGWRYAGSATSLSGPWANTPAAVGPTQGDTATWTTSGGGTAVLELAGFGLEQVVPAGAVVQQLGLRVRTAVPQGTVDALTAQCYVGATPVGAAQPLVVDPASHEDVITVTGVAYDDLPDLRVQISATRAGAADVYADVYSDSY